MKLTLAHYMLTPGTMHSLAYYVCWHFFCFVVVVFCFFVVVFLFFFRFFVFVVVVVVFSAYLVIVLIVICVEMNHVKL